MQAVYFVDENIIASLAKLRNLVSDAPLFIMESLSELDFLSLT
jgi:hypothetical protein